MKNNGDLLPFLSIFPDRASQIVWLEKSSESLVLLVHTSSLLEFLIFGM